MVTAEELQKIMPNLPTAKRDLYLPHLRKAMEEFEIKTYMREAAFLAQLAHESGELRWMEEIADGSKYEGRANLGNTHPGDGKRFKGRGPIQLTGRANYKLFGTLLGLDLIGDPKQAATPEVGFRIAGLYWQRRKLNALADQLQDAFDKQDVQTEKKLFEKITRGINGGVNGLADREKYYKRAKLVLSRDDTAPEPIRVVVNQTEVTDAQGFLRNGRSMAALRPVATAAGWRILSAADGLATIQDTKQANHDIALLIENGKGFVALRDLPGTVAFDNETKTVSLTTTI